MHLSRKPTPSTDCICRSPLFNQFGSQLKRLGTVLGLLRFLARQLSWKSHMQSIPPTRYTSASPIEPSKLQSSSSSALSAIANAGGGARPSFIVDARRLERFFNSAFCMSEDGTSKYAVFVSKYYNQAALAKSNDTPQVANSSHYIGRTN